MSAPITFRKQILPPLPPGRNSWLSVVPRKRIPRHVTNALSAIGPADVDVLIIGPATPEKEQYAEFVHRNSPRARAAFVSLNCSALPPHILGGELLRDIEGGVNGVFVEGPIGAAEDGTLFLDEIQALSLPSQMKLLRFIQQKEYRRIGETHLRRANVRLIVGSSADLVAAVQAGSLLEELLVQLRPFPVK